MSNIIAGIPQQDYKIGVPVSIQENISFDDNPGEAVKLWKQMLSEDIQAGKQIKDYRVFTLFQNLPQEQRNKIAEYIRSNFTLELSYPPGKICLAVEKDALENKLKNYSPKNLIVFLYSINGEKKAELPLPKEGDPARPEIYEGSYKHLLGMSPSTIPGEETVKQLQNMIIMGEGDNEVIFYIMEGLNIGNNEKNKIKEMYNLIVKLNEIIPSKPVREVNIVSEGDSFYNQFDHGIEIYFNETALLGITAHEMGHAIFNVLRIEEDKLWQKIYWLSLGFKNYEIVDDSNYDKVPDVFGHPYDNASELFASSFKTYILYSDKLIENILDPDTKNEAQKMGKLIFYYLRDRIFSGKVFSEKGLPQPESFEIDKAEIAASLINGLGDSYPFVRLWAAQAIGKSKDKSIIECLIKALGSDNPNVRHGAARAIGELGRKDQRLIMPLIKLLGDSDSLVKDAAAQTIGKLKDKRAIEPLIEALNGDDPSLNEGAARAIGELGIKDKRFVKPLWIALGDTNPLVVFEAAWAIGKLGIKDKSFVEPLNWTLSNNEYYYVRREAAWAIGELGIKDQRSIELLVKALGDRKPYVRKAAAEALGNIGDESIVPALQELADNDDEEEVRKAAREALDNLGIKDK